MIKKSDNYRDIWESDINKESNTEKEAMNHCTKAIQKIKQRD